MSISELLPSVTALSHADKLQLVQLLTAQLAQTDQTSEPPTSFHPKQFFGVANQSRQVVDEYLASTREGWL